MKRAYAFFLLLYPREHRNQFAEEMTRVFEEASAERRALGWSWYVRFILWEMSGLIAGAVGAWLSWNWKRSPETSSASAAPNTLPQDLLKAQQRVELMTAAMVRAIANRQFERARVHSDEERQARENLRILREKYGISS
jgi:hypothetical protein